jgi:hypothetical protein
MLYPTSSVAHFLSLLCDTCHLLHLTQMDVSFDPVAYTLRGFMSFNDVPVPGLSINVSVHSGLQEMISMVG